LKLADLRRAGRSPQLPLTVQLPQGDLVVQRWLRVLPNRRYVGVAVWQGRPVLVKLLVGANAGRDYRREYAGNNALVGAGLATPALLAHGIRSGSGAWLLFDYLAGAESLGNRWQTVAAEPPLTAAQEEVLGTALAALGALHAKGLWQEDLHLDNLLCNNTKIFWVDCGSIRCAQPGRPLAAGRAGANLGVFFAQLPVGIDPLIGRLLDGYRRGGGTSGVTPAAVLREVRKARHWRLRDYLGKTGRDCTLFSVRRGPQELNAVCREELTALQSLLADPDRFIAAGKSLKAGGSATVSLVDVNGRPLVVKRYNIKGLTHWLRRCWRPSRGWHSWREGHRLGFLGIATPRPLAVLERRFGWLRGTAWLVSEHLGGEHILIRFNPHVDGAPPEVELAALEGLFAALLRERISHGDLKGTNLIWHDGEWALIDLDAVRQHRCNLTFARAYVRDRARFLRNWPADSALHRLLDQRLPQVPDTCGPQRG